MFNLEMLHETVELFLSIFVFVLLSADSYTNLPWHVSHALAPDESVKTSIDTDVLDMLR